jgi:hypothetical protein
MSRFALLAAGVFSFCTPDFCAMGPPLQVWPSPLNVRRAPPPVPPPMTQDQERNFIIRQGEAYCRKFPTDKICHFQGNPP